MTSAEILSFPIRLEAKAIRKGMVAIRFLSESIFSAVRRLKCLVIGTMEDHMEAKGQAPIKTESELRFFELIEKRMAQQGFEVLETVCKDRKRTTQSKQTLASNWTSFSY